MTAGASARVTLAAHDRARRRRRARGARAGGSRTARSPRASAASTRRRSVRDVTATAHAHGGCVAVSIDLLARDLQADAPGRIATAAALARQEIASELAEAPRRVDRAWRKSSRTARAIRATRPTSRRGGRSRAGSRAPARRACASPIAIGASPRDATGRTERPETRARRQARGSIRTELDRATIAWHEPVVEARTRVETGQGEAWIALVASPCGTLPEMEDDAGLGAAVRAGRGRSERPSRVRSGRAARAPRRGRRRRRHRRRRARPARSRTSRPRRHARDASPTPSARSFAADARRSRRGRRTARARVCSRAPRTSATTRARSSRRSPKRSLPGILRGWRRWAPPKRSGAPRTRRSRRARRRSAPGRCAWRSSRTPTPRRPTPRRASRSIAGSRAGRASRARAPVGSEHPSAPRPGDVRGGDARDGGGSGGVARASRSPRETSRRRATSAYLAAASLDGADGLLAHALGGGLARSWSARVVGGAARLGAGRAGRLRPNGTLDAAVAQARALFDRLRQGSLADADRARAVSLLADRDLAASLDPRAPPRLASGRAPTPEPAQPTLEALRAFASTWLHDDALVIVAVRPPRRAEAAAMTHDPETRTRAPPRRTSLRGSASARTTCDSSATASKPSRRCSRRSRRLSAKCSSSSTGSLPTPSAPSSATRSSSARRRASPCA